MYYHRQRKFTYILIYLGAMHFAFINSSVYYCLLTYLFRGKKLPIKKTFTSCISTYLVVVVPFIRCKDIKKFFKKATPLASFTLYIPIYLSYFQLTPVMGVLLIVGSSIALVFLTISAYFCVRKRLVSRGGGSSTGNRNSGGGAEIRTYSVGYNVESSNVVVSEANEFETSMNPDVIPRSKGMYCYYFKVSRYRYSTYI